MCGGSKITSYTKIANNVTSASSAHTYTIEKAGMYLAMSSIASQPSTTTKFITTTGTEVLNVSQVSNSVSGSYATAEVLLADCKVGDTITFSVRSYGRHSLYLLS